ncbi:MAG: GNAT family N-acyltransferase [Cypionkella sp.]|nr:GNAT family N-acyltransferase [Cypionkella sp.]
MLKQDVGGQGSGLGGYTVRVAHSRDDMTLAMALRRARFGAGEDDFDAGCMQILIQFQGDLCATFRLRPYASGAELGQGYSAQFYDVRALAAMSRPALELGRFCVVDGAHQIDALRLSFAAMAAQVDNLGAGVLFGCASFHGENFDHHRPALSLLKSHISADWPITCLAAHHIDLKSLSHTKDEEVAALRGVPPLLRSYLSLGGWVGGAAVRDDDLGTYHVFTALEVDKIPAPRAMALRKLAASLQWRL